jgi:outer membrane protein assembly factor BamD (BamD/ComL family)
MNRRNRVALGLATIAFALLPLAALAAPTITATNIVPPKIKLKGYTTAAVAGKGNVVVQVLVRPDGSHQAMRVIHSSNVGDNRAAMQIAQTSTYHPATRDGKPTIWLYDYTLIFKGPSAAGSGSTSVDVGVSASGKVGQIERMIRIGNYAGAKTMAGTYLLSNPSDSRVRSLLGVADFYAKDDNDAAAAFSQAGMVDSRFKAVAAHAFASAAVNLASSDPGTAVGYGQKALALDSGPNSLYALGIAQLGAKDTASAVANLKKARTRAFADKATDKTSKVNLDSALLQAYAAQNDTADVQTTSAEILQLDPSSTLPKRILGNQYLNAAIADMQAGKSDDAISNFDLAGQNGDPQVQVTAYGQAALALANAKKPDYDKVKAYADKAMAVDPNDALANYAEGVALTGQWSVGGRKDAAKKQAAIDACTKAEAAAAAANNTTLKFQIESFVKDNLK